MRHFSLGWTPLSAQGHNQGITSGGILPFLSFLSIFHFRCLPIFLSLRREAAGPLNPDSVLTEEALQVPPWDRGGLRTISAFLCV